MAEKKKGKKRKEEIIATGEPIPVKPSKDEYKIAKWLRKNVPIKKTKFLNHNVEYFTASKAVDALLDSQFAKGDEPLFKSREDIAEYLHVMLEHKFFHRARKVPVSEQELKTKKKKGTEVTDEKGKIKDKGTDGEQTVAEAKQDATQSEKEKRKRKIRLDMHNDQRFVDGLDAYVWIYDPIPFHYWIFGTLFVLGTIGVCLFPLWPPSVRLGVYYLSVASAAFLVLIILLVIVRLILFCVVWMCTFGNHHIWILPNLTEDVGFFASFWPLYKYEYKGDEIRKKKKKAKDSDNEEESEDKQSKVQEVTDITPSDSDKKTEGEATTPEGGQAETLGASESESESSQRSSTGKDFEILDQDELFS